MWRRLNFAFALPLVLILLAATPLRAESAATAPNDLPSLAPMLEGAVPAVVNIAVLSRSPFEDNPLFQDPFFRHFFDLPEEPQPQLSAGSGVIVDAERGYVLTNNHVVANALEIAVTLADGRRLAAELVGGDPGTDIALLRIPAQNLKALEFGDSDTLRVGDYVVAIGNPFGIGQTATLGIVSALGRTGLSTQGYENFIQTDASINPGNSGGALVDLRGRLVGINAAIIGPAGGNIGIGFAVPSNMARAVMEQLVAWGEVRRGILGVLVRDLTPDLAQALRLDVIGALVTQVLEDTPAERAGIKAGDVIVAVDGLPVTGAARLRARIGLVQAGQSVTISVVRDDRSLTIRARIEAVPKTQPEPEADTPAETLIEGATLRNFNGGVLVVSLADGSPAWRYGLRKGDVIAAANRAPVRNVAELEKAFEAGGNLLALTIDRDDSVLIIVVER